MSIKIFNFKCWGFGALLKGHLSRGNEGGESAGYSLPPLTIHAGSRLELATVRLQVRLSGHDFPQEILNYIFEGLIWGPQAEHSERTLGHFKSAQNLYSHYD